MGEAPERKRRGKSAAAAADASATTAATAAAATMHFGRLLRKERPPNTHNTHVVVQCGMSGRGLRERESLHAQGEPFFCNCMDGCGEREICPLILISSLLPSILLQSSSIKKVALCRQIWLLCVAAFRFSASHTRVSLCMCSYRGMTKQKQATRTQQQPIDSVVRKGRNGVE